MPFTLELRSVLFVAGRRRIYGLAANGCRRSASRTDAALYRDSTDGCSTERAARVALDDPRRRRWLEERGSQGGSLLRGRVQRSRNHRSSAAGLAASRASAADNPDASSNCTSRAGPVSVARPPGSPSRSDPASSGTPARCRRPTRSMSLGISSARPDRASAVAGVLIMDSYRTSVGTAVTREAARRRWRHRRQAIATVHRRVPVLRDARVNRTRGQRLCRVLDRADAGFGRRPRGHADG